MRRVRACALAVAVALGLAASCSSGGQGELAACVAPGAACCEGGACAVGLICQDAVCVVVEAGAPVEASSIDAGDAGGG